MGNRNIRLACALLIAVVLGLSCPAVGVNKEATALPILMYHQINSDPESWGAYTISPEMFVDDLNYLQSKGYETVTAAALEAYTRGAFTLPAKPVMITFDDGYESFTQYALPALEERGMTAVISIVGAFSDAYTEEEDHNIAYSYYSWPDLGALKNSPAVELSAHTNNMHWLKDRQGCRIMSGESTEHYQQAFHEDLQELENRFSQYCNIKPIAFAYPFGFYCKEGKAVLQERAYRVLFTCDQKINYITGRPEELLNLGRYNRGSTLSCQQLFTKLKLN